MDRYEDFNSYNARALGISQIVFTALTLIFGIVQASAFASWFLIAPVIYSLCQVAPITLGLLASKRKSKCTVVASMILNILAAIFCSFNQICYSIAYTVLSSYYWSFTTFPDDSYNRDFYGWSKNVQVFSIISILMVLTGLALFIINIWAAVLGYVSCRSTPAHVQYTGQGGHVVVMQTSNISSTQYAQPGYAQGPQYVVLQPQVQGQQYPALANHQTYAPAVTAPSTYAPQNAYPTK